MAKELTDDTKEALAAQGGATSDEKIIDSDVKDDLPDITLRDQNDAENKGTTDDSDPKGDGASGDNKEDDSELNQGVTKTLEGAGYTEKILTDRLTKDGGISDEFIAELKEKIDPEYVDAHVGRLRAEMELAKVTETGKLDAAQKKMEQIQGMNKRIFDSVGGEDNFKVLGKALKDNLPENELTALNVKLASGNNDIVDEAMKFAVKKYNDIRGMGGKLMEGDAGQGTEPAVHITKEEYRMYMRTDKYKTDPKYRQKIDDDRLATRTADSKQYGAGQYYGYHPTKGRYSL